MAAQIEYPQDINLLAPLAKAGDQGAREALFAAAYPFVRWLIKEEGWFLPSGGDAQDLVQEGVASLIKALRTWNPDKCVFLPFARMAIERHVATQLRMAHYDKRRANHGAYSLDAPAHRDKHGQVDHDADDRLSRWNLQDPAGIGQDPADLVAESEVGLLLAALTEGFSEIERAAVQRCLLNGEEYNDVARELGRRQKSIDNAMQRARRKFIRRAAQLADDPQFSPEVRGHLGRLAQKAGDERRPLTDEEVRANLPVEVLRPTGLRRFASKSHRWIPPADQVLAVYPNIREVAKADPVKQAVFTNYLAGQSFAAMAENLQISQGACEHHLRRLCQQAARDAGSAPTWETPADPLQQRVEQLWRDGFPISEIKAALSMQAPEREIVRMIGNMYNQEHRRRNREMPVAIETKRIPLVPLKKVPSLIARAKPLLPAEYVETLRLYMQGYPRPEIAERRGVNPATIEKTDLPLIRKALRGISGFEWLLNRVASDRQTRRLAIEALGYTVEQALALIPRQHVEAFRHYLDGLGHEDIGDRCGVPGDLAGRRIRYCMDCLWRHTGGTPGGRRSKVVDRNRAVRIRKDEQMHQRFTRLGHLLDGETRRMLELYYQGLAMGDIVDAIGMAGSRTAKQTTWYRIKRLGEHLKRLDEESIHLVPAGAGAAIERGDTHGPA
jgi:RNA polymerase sporulation-specific sigma factor